jgi:hypothetical protein
MAFSLGIRIGIYWIDWLGSWGLTSDNGSGGYVAPFVGRTAIVVSG